MPIFSVPVSIGHPDKGELEHIPVTVDSGASISMLPKSLLDRLGIEVIQQRLIQTLGGTDSIQLGLVKISIFGEERTFPVAFGSDEMAFIGTPVLDAFNLIVDPRNQRLLRGLEDREFDTFVAHASEDKDQVARPLAEILKTDGLAVWFDEFEITIGDSITARINQGLARSRSGIVIISPAFFQKRWPQSEVNGMVSLMMDGRYTLLPVWHNVSKKEVSDYSPILGDLKAENTSENDIATIAQTIGDKIKSIAYEVP